jgi:hypothetical protein
METILLAVFLGILAAGVLGISWKQTRGGGTVFDEYDEIQAARRRLAELMDESDR